MMRKYLVFLVIFLLAFLGVYDNVMATNCEINSGNQKSTGHVSNSYQESVYAAVYNPNNITHAGDITGNNYCGPYFNKNETDEMEVLFIKSTSTNYSQNDVGVINAVRPGIPFGTVFAANYEDEVVPYLLEGFAFYEPFLDLSTTNACPNYIKSTNKKTDAMTIGVAKGYHKYTLYTDAKNFDEADYFYGRDLISTCKYHIPNKRDVYITYYNNGENYFRVYYNQTSEQSSAVKFFKYDDWKSFKIDNNKNCPTVYGRQLKTDSAEYFIDLYLDDPADDISFKLENNGVVKYTDTHEGVYDIIYEFNDEKFKKYEDEFKKCVSKVDEKERNNCLFDQNTTFEKFINRLSMYCNDVYSKCDWNSQAMEFCDKADKQISNIRKEYGLKGGSCGLSSNLINWIANIFKWVKYIAPVVAIILGMLDFIKAVASQNDDDMKKAQGKFIKRLIAAALLFIIPFIIEFVLDKFHIGTNGFCNLNG